jgi:hypothetical protein
MITAVFVDEAAGKVAIELDNGDSGIAIVDPTWDGDSADELGAEYRELWRKP